MFFMNKKELEIILSQLTRFKNPKVRLEQYPTSSDVAADLLWNVCSNKHVKGKVIADLGCGPGTFGLGALVLGAKKVYFVDVDKEAIDVAKKNKKLIEKVLGKKLNCDFLNIDVRDFDKKVNVVIQNPPFGVKQTHHDKLFLLKAMEVAPVVYSFHKISTKGFVEKFVKENEFKVKHLYRYDLPIKKRFWFHTSRVKYVEVGCWGISRR